MKSFFSNRLAWNDRVQNRLVLFAVVFVILYAVILTLSPAVRLHSWLVDYKWMHWIGVVIWAVGILTLNPIIEKRFPDRDPFLYPVTALLSGWGLLTIWRLDNEFGLRQTIWFAVGFGLLWGLGKIPNILDWLKKYKYLILVSGLLITALTFVFGVYPGGIGPRLWLGGGGIYIQPSEPLKMLLVVYLAAYLSERMLLKFRLFQLLNPTLVLMAFALGVLVIQKDVGTAIVFVIIYTLLIYLAVGKKRILVISALAILAAGLSGYFLLGNIQTRLQTWINPWIDPAGTSYQVIQSLISIGAGGTFGRGVGLGSPSLVPVAHSDFIFTAIAEETGLTGSMALIGCWALLVVRGLRTAYRVKTPYHRLVASGISIYFAVQCILIIGGNIRLLPLTGITLPFMSYGGSSLITAMAGMYFLIFISNAEPGSAPNKAATIPYQLITGVFLIAFLGLGLVDGYWGFVRSGDLQTRVDNARPIISDRYVRRGAILDRNNGVIAQSSGEPGNYQRTLLVPALSPVIGYTNFYYGQSGLEKSMNGYLRGMEGNSASTIWGTHLLYGQNPPGLDIRLSIDLQLQATADGLLNGRKGALVLLNASTGEILAMSSAPYFDANQVEALWQTYKDDPNSPFLNRAVQGSYYPGTALGPLLLAEAWNNQILSEAPYTSSAFINGQLETCAAYTSTPLTWNESVHNGCPGTTSELLKINQNSLPDLFQRLGFLTAPDVPLESAPRPLLRPYDTRDYAEIGEDPAMLISPLQMALAASTLSNHGVRPSPRLVIAIHNPAQGWVVLPAGDSTKVFPAEAADQTAVDLTSSTGPYWDMVGNIKVRNDQYTWYLAGSLPDWQGTPFVLAMVVENKDSFLIRYLGEQMMKEALQPKK